jgi:ABC-type multidrug transport system fused ATPase/permease subunit
VTRYLRLWIDLLKLSWHEERGLTATVFGLEILGAVGAVGSALALRAAVNGLVGKSVSNAIVAAVLAAILCTVNLVVSRLHGLIGLFLAVEKVGVVLEERMLYDVAALERIEHLERPEYLDRITVLQGAGRRLMGGMWTAVRTVFTSAQLIAMLIILGQVSAVLLVLVILAIAPLWCDKRARRLESKAETGSAEMFRLQRQLFELATEPGWGKEIRAARAGDVLVTRMSAAWSVAMRERTAARVRGAVLRGLGWLIFVGGFVAVLALAMSRRTSSATTPGDVVLVVTLTITLQQAVQTAVGQLTTTLNAGIYIEPYLWLREYVAADVRSRKATQAPPERLMSGIEITDLTYTYPGTDSPALNGVTVRLPAGSVVALVGEYGSGKTTLVKLLSKFYRPDSGSITIDGVDLETLETGQWRRRMSAAYQDFGRYPQTTFAEAVGMGDLDRIDDDAAVMNAIDAADARRIVQRLPAGRDTRLGLVYGGIDLSEGQWQKTALARASMRTKPVLFVLDEPTASLDAPSEHAIFERYMQRARSLAERNGAITLVVSHRLSTVAGADLVLVLDNGRLAESGSHHDLMKSGGRYSDLYGLQASAYKLIPTHSDPVSSPTSPIR